MQEGFVDLLDRNHFHVGNDTVLGAEIEHLLRLLYAADQRTSKIAAFKDEAEDLKTSLTDAREQALRDALAGAAASDAALPVTGSLS